MPYLLFNAERKDFDDGEGNPVSLGEHLSYLSNYGGSADCWDSLGTESRASAIQEARESGLHLFIVDEYSYRVVGRVNQPEK